MGEDKKVWNLPLLGSSLVRALILDNLKKQKFVLPDICILCSYLVCGGICGSSFCLLYCSYSHLVDSPLSDWLILSFPDFYDLGIFTYYQLICRSRNMLLGAL